jgi:hypothetical protein
MVQILKKNLVGIATDGAPNMREEKRVVLYFCKIIRGDFFHIMNRKKWLRSAQLDVMEST